jgi:hypothetical protein
MVTNHPQELLDVVAKLSGATAVSSTNDRVLAFPFIAIDRPSAASRTDQMAACAAGSSARW